MRAEKTLINLSSLIHLLSMCDHCQAQGLGLPPLEARHVSVAAQVNRTVSSTIQFKRLDMDMEADFEWVYDVLWIFMIYIFIDIWWIFPFSLCAHKFAISTWQHLSFLLYAAISQHNGLSVFYSNQRNMQTSSIHQKRNCSVVIFYIRLATEQTKEPILGDHYHLHCPGVKEREGCLQPPQQEGEGHSTWSAVMTLGYNYDVGYLMDIIDICICEELWSRWVSWEQGQLILGDREVCNSIDRHLI